MSGQPDGHVEIRDDAGTRLQFDPDLPDAAYESFISLEKTSGRWYAGDWKEGHWREIDPKA